MRHRGVYPVLLLFVLNILLGTPVSAQSPRVVWGTCLGGSGNDAIQDILVWNDDGVIAAGYTNSSDGDVPVHYGSTLIGDAWVIRLNASGQIIWSKIVGGSGDDQFKSITRTHDGGFICAGSTNSTDHDLSGNHGNYDFLVARFSASGQLLWAHNYGGSMNEEATDIIETSDGNFAVTGYTRSNDGDISSNSNTAHDRDAWIIMLNPQGTIRWEKTISASGYDNAGYSIQEDENRQLLVYTNTMIQYSTTYDGYTSDVTEYPGLIKYLNPFNGDTISSLQTDGDYSFALRCFPGGIATSFQDNVWRPSMQCSDHVVYHSIKRANATAFTSTELQNHDCTLIYMNLVHPAASQGLAVLPDQTRLVAGYADYTGDQTDGYLAIDGTHSIRYGGTGYDGFTSVDANALGDRIYCGGYVGAGYGGTLNGHHGNNDGWVVQFRLLNSISGSVFLDNNHNHLPDAGEPAFNQGVITSRKYNQQIVSTPYSGQFKNMVDTGTWVTSFTVTGRPYYTIYPATYSNSFSTYNSQAIDHFAVEMIPGKRDYSISLVSLSPVRPGFTSEFLITCRNVGTDTLQNQLLELRLDPRLTFLSSSLNPSSVHGDTLLWELNSIKPDSVQRIYLTCDANTPPLLNINDTLRLNASLPALLDLNPLDNNTQLTLIATGSFDPNDIREIHGGSISSARVRNGEYLQYLIRFQNTGTDTAFRVLIRDTISNSFNPATVETIASSHPCNFISGGGKNLIWDFQQILLPDSNRNESGSHGWVAFRVKPADTVALGSVLRNKASIYFDYNFPVITNTEITTITNLQTCTWTGALSDQWEAEDNWQNKLVPDAFSLVSIPAGTQYSPVLRSNPTIWKLIVQPGAGIRVDEQYHLTIIGK